MTPPPPAACHYHKLGSSNWVPRPDLPLALLTDRAAFCVVGGDLWVTGGILTNGGSQIRGDMCYFQRDSLKYTQQNFIALFGVEYLYSTITNG